MGNNKDIGKAYKEQLEGYSSSPHNRVWENIEADLKKSKRRIFPIWKILTGFGILLLITSIGIFSYKSNSTNSTFEIEQSQQNVLDNDSTSKTDHYTSSKSNNDKDQNKSTSNTNANNVNINSNQNKPNTGITSTLLNPNNTQKKPVINVNTNPTTYNSKNKLAVSIKTNPTNDTGERLNNSNSKSTNNLSKTKSTQNKNTTQKTNTNTLTNNTTVVSQNKSELKPNTKLTTASSNSANNTVISSSSDSKKENDILVADLNKIKDSIQSNDKTPIVLNIEDLIDSEKTKDSEKPEKLSYPLSISTYISPTYTNTFGNGSSIDPRLDNNKITGRLNINYGIAATVKISEKSSLRFGIGASKLSYTIKGADTTSTTEGGGFLINASGYSNLTVNSQASNSVPNIFSPNSALDFQQKIKYIETPLNYIYHLKNDTKINIDLVGGFSALFLSDQSITAKDRNGNSLEIGKVENLKKTNFSFNLGSNLSYSLSKKLSLNLEPTFQYYLSTFNNNVDSKPYSFGLRFGIRYRF